MQYPAIPKVYSSIIRIESVSYDDGTFRRVMIKSKVDRTEIWSRVRPTSLEPQLRMVGPALIVHEPRRGVLQETP